MSKGKKNKEMKYLEENFLNFAEFKKDVKAQNEKANRVTIGK